MWGINRSTPLFTKKNFINSTNLVTYVPPRPTLPSMFDLPHLLPPSHVFHLLPHHLQNPKNKMVDALQVQVKMKIGSCWKKVSPPALALALAGEIRTCLKVFDFIICTQTSFLNMHAHNSFFIPNTLINSSFYFVLLYYQDLHSDLVLSHTLSIWQFTFAQLIRDLSFFFSFFKSWVFAQVSIDSMSFWNISLRNIGFLHMFPFLFETLLIKTLGFFEILGFFLNLGFFFKSWVS